LQKDAGQPSTVINHHFHRHQRIAFRQFVQHDRLGLFLVEAARAEPISGNAIEAKRWLDAIIIASE